MRAVIWFVLLFVVAVVASTTLGTNDGLVSIYAGKWRFDVSLNLFLLVLIGSCFLLVTVIQAVNSLIGLPQRAREWRTLRRDQAPRQRCATRWCSSSAAATAGRRNPPSVR